MENILEKWSMGLRREKSGISFDGVHMNPLVCATNTPMVTPITTMKGHAKASATATPMRASNWSSSSTDRCISCRCSKIGDSAVLRLVAV